MRMMRVHSAARLAGGALLASAAFGPASALGATTVVGSDLSHPADTTVQHGADTAVWNVTLGPGGSAAPGAATMPSDGQIVTIRLKGIAQTSHTGVAPLTQIHFQDLVPQPDGSVRVDVTTGAFSVPTSGDPNQVSEFHPENFCVHRGDYVAFNDEGGFDPNNYPNGVAFQVLSGVTGSVADEYTKDNGTMNGARFTGSPRTNQELLVQEVLATGPDATPLCPGGTRGRAPAPGTPRASTTRPASLAVTIPKQTAKVDSSGSVQIVLACHASTPCAGSLALRTASGASRPGGAALGTANFSLAPNATSKVKVQLSATVRRLLRRRHGRGLRVLVSVSGGPGQANSGPHATIKLTGGR